MLVQHFLPSSNATTSFDSSFSPCSPSTITSSLMKNQNASILSPFFNSESTGFQPTIDQNIRFGRSEKIKTHLSAWPSKLTSVMEIHRQRFSQLNPRFKQQRATATLLQSVQQPVVCPAILPSTTRPQHRQQPRSKQNQQTHFPPAQSNRRPNTAQLKQQQQQQQSLSESNRQYITLTNLTKILHVLQTQVRTNDNETSTDMSTSTSNSAKQRVQQHLQNTATRWWKPIRSSDCQTQIQAPSSIYTYGTSVTSTNVPSTDLVQQHRHEPDSFPLITIVSNSTRQFQMPSNNGNETFKYDESESSTEIQTSTIIPSIIQPPATAVNSKRIRQEPLIMQPRGMRLHSYDHHHHHHYYYKNPNTMNFLQQQRLIRQT
ncbi:unnamed protein product [Rotaria socialis]|uniref:Uncharacterized protein n=1 Tax=Rotaria socialis TaxID=392032 RepID=A0A817Y2B1_9BILA|nr:unnamed protein product [Rotaria socialis]CAF3329314.1 unnamed protein product [Rotaria socialis]CAF3347285.1 unnamed protein product [Rotaria socialis]CAF3373813.1 unnamed protein product [Rotaria socialis]CAF3448740.1 unnamed protein product [Rotaria socialis]